jgi:hypothetical protein
MNVRVRRLRYQTIAQAVVHLRRRNFSLLHPLLRVRREEHSGRISSCVAYQAPQALIVQAEGSWARNRTHNYYG